MQLQPFVSYCWGSPSAWAKADKVSLRRPAIQGQSNFKFSEKCNNNNDNNNNNNKYFKPEAYGVVLQQNLYNINNINK